MREERERERERGEERERENERVRERRKGRGSEGDGGRGVRERMCKDIMDFFTQLERLILKCGLKGPSWLHIKRPSKLSW